MKKSIVFTAIVLSLLIFAPHLFSPSQISFERAEGEVIDIHLHIAGLGYGESDLFIGSSLRESIKFPFYLRAFGITEELLRESGDGVLVERVAAHIRDSIFIDKAVILALDGRVGQSGELDKERTEIFVSNEFVAREVAKYPELLFGASVNPYRRDAIERLVKVSNNGAVLVKWIPCNTVGQPIRATRSMT